MGAGLLLFVMGAALAWEGEALEASGEGTDRDGFEVPVLDDNDGEAVVGGAQADFGRWPDAAGVVIDGYVSCTGVLVHPKVVLTASHCVGGIRRVVLNSNDWARNGETYRVEREIPFARQWWDNPDIAVLILEDEVTNVAPRVIARDCIEADYLTTGAPVQVVGFGTIDKWGERGTSLLMEGTTYVQDPDCTSSRDGCFPAISPGGELGAGGNGVDACYGDSGGPLYLTTPEGDFLVGLTSRAYDWVNAPCGEGGIYVRPDAVIEWIEATAGVTLPRPVCNQPAVVRDIDQRLVPQGKSERIRPRWSDSDSNGHRLALHTAPVQGTVTVDGDAIHHTAPLGYLGPDHFLVELIDDQGEWPAPQVLIEVPIEVVQRGLGARCGCASGGGVGGGLGAWSFGLVLLGAMARRRR